MAVQRGTGFVEFQARREEIEDLVRRGFSSAQIHKKLGLKLGYRQLHRYIKVHFPTNTILEAASPLGRPLQTRKQKTIGATSSSGTSEQPVQTSPGPFSTAPAVQPPGHKPKPIRKRYPPADQPKQAVQTGDAELNTIIHGKNEE